MRLLRFLRLDVPVPRETEHALDVITGSPDFGLGYVHRDAGLGIDTTFSDWCIQFGKRRKRGTYPIGGISVLINQFASGAPVLPDEIDAKGRI